MFLFAFLWTQREEAQIYSGMAFKSRSEYPRLDVIKGEKDNFLCLTDATHVYTAQYKVLPSPEM